MRQFHRPAIPSPFPNVRIFTNAGCLRFLGCREPVPLSGQTISNSYNPERRARMEFIGVRPKATSDGNLGTSHCKGGGNVGASRGRRCSFSR